VPVPVYCRPLAEKEPGMKVLCWLPYDKGFSIFLSLCIRFPTISLSTLSTTHSCI
jgi:hypothetical protein